MPFKTKIICLLWCFWAPVMVFAQAPDSHKKEFYVDADSVIFYPLSEPFYLSLGTTPGSTDISLNLNNAKDQEGTSFSKSGKVNFDIVKYSGMRIPYGRFALIMDGTNPKTTSSFLEAPKYVRNGVIYYGKGLQTSLVSTDTYSGVKATYFSRNNNSFSPFNQNLIFDQEGVQNLSFYAADLVGNVEAVKQDNFTVDLTAPVTTYTTEGNTSGDILSKTARIKLESTDALAGVSTIQWQLDGKNYRKYINPINILQLRDGTHTLSYKAMDWVKNEETIKQYTFEVDRIAPLISYRFEGEQFIKNRTTYIRATTKLKLMGVDNRSGLAEMRYRLNTNEEENYSTEISFNDTIGSHVLLYYGIDQVGNSTKSRNNSLRFTFDNKAPSFKVAYKSPNFLTKDTMYVREYTRITAKISDKQSGVQHSFCQVDSGTVFLFKGEMTIKEEGYHQLYFTHTDWVNNVSKDTIGVFVDRLPPEISHQMSTNTLGEKKIKEEIYQLVSAESKVFMSAIDQESGVDELYYVINGGAKKDYSGAIDSFRKNTPIILELYAVDQLGNTKREVIRLYIEE